MLVASTRNHALWQPIAPRLVRRWNAWIQVREVHWPNAWSISNESEKRMIQQGGVSRVSDGHCAWWLHPDGWLLSYFLFCFQFSVDIGGYRQATGQFAKGLRLSAGFVSSRGTPRMDGFWFPLIPQSWVMTRVRPQPFLIKTCWYGVGRPSPLNGLSQWLIRSPKARTGGGATTVPYISPPNVKHYLWGGCFHPNFRCCVLIDRLTATCTPMAETSHLNDGSGNGNHGKRDVRSNRGVGRLSFASHFILAKTGRAEDWGFSSTKTRIFQHATKCDPLDIPLSRQPNPCIVKTFPSPLLPE